MLVDISLYSTTDDIQELCKAQPGMGTVMGCATTPKVGKVTIHAVQPTNWCDWVRLKVIGHEVMHGLGFYHSSEYGFWGSN